MCLVITINYEAYELLMQYHIAAVASHRRWPMASPYHAACDPGARYPASHLTPPPPALSAEVILLLLGKRGKTHSASIPALS